MMAEEFNVEVLGDVEVQLLAEAYRYDGDALIKAAYDALYQARHEIVRLRDALRRIEGDYQIGLNALRRMLRVGD